VDVRSNLWDLLLKLCSPDSVGFKDFGNAIRHVHKLPLFYDEQTGHWRLMDSYLRWYIMTHTKDNNFLPVPCIGIPPELEQALTRFLSLFSAIFSRSDKLFYAQFESKMAAVFYVDLSAEGKQMLREQCCRIYKTECYDDNPHGKLACWMTRVIFSKCGTSNSDVVFKQTIPENFLNWLTYDTKYNPMWNLALALRNFFAHAIDEFALNIQQKTDLIAVAQNLWGDEGVHYIFWNQNCVMLSLLIQRK